MTHLQLQHKSVLYVIALARKRQWYALLLLGMLLMSCSTLFYGQKEAIPLPDEGYAIYEGWGFALHVPETAEVNSRVCEDFMLYEFL
jgi:hypothetical protein